MYKNLSYQSHENKESNFLKPTNPFSILQIDWGCTLEKGGMKFDKKKWNSSGALEMIALEMAELENCSSDLTNIPTCRKNL